MLSSRDHGTSYISKREIRFANEERADVQLVETAYITAFRISKITNGNLRNHTD